MTKRRAVMTEAQARRFIRAARAEDPTAIIEFVTEAGTIRISSEQGDVASAPDRLHDKRKPIPWT